jgi:hypothetical protein
MKISIEKFGLWSVHEKHISLKVECHAKDSIEVKHLEKDTSCALYIKSYKIASQIGSATLGKKSVNILLRFDHNFKIIEALWNFSNAESHGGYILTEEKTDPELFAIAHRLLREVSVLRGVSPETIMKEVTYFKPGTERDELRFVSEKQLPVVRDKLKEILEKK